VALEGTMAAKMRNGGSACTSANRIYVHRSLHDTFVEELRARLAAMTTGPGLVRDNDLGALVSVKERDKVAALVDQAVSEGAHIALGGKKIPGSGAFYPPTLLTGVVHGATITFDEIDEVVEMANDTDFGLIAYVFGEDGEALRVAQRIQAGMVGVNRGVISDPAAPFGGMKQSGLGREGSSDGILEFLEEKYIAMTA